MTSDERNERHTAITVLLRSVSDTVPGEHDRLRNLHGHALTLWHDAEVGGASWIALTSLLCGSTEMYVRLAEIEGEQRQRAAVEAAQRHLRGEGDV